MTMRILYASTMYPPSVGGAQIHLHCLARQMQRDGHRVHVVTHSSRNRSDWVRLATVNGEQREDYVHEGVPVSRLGFDRRTRAQMAPWAATYYATMPWAVPRLGRLIEKNFPPLEFEPSLVHVSRIGREFIAQAGLNFARRRDIPFVLTPNHHPRWHGWRYREYDRIYRAADAVIVLTDSEKQMLVEQKGLLPERIHVTGIGPVLADEYSTVQFREAYGIEGDFVLFLGQQLPYKGIGAVMQAARQVWRDHPKVKFVFIGPPTSHSRRLFAKARDRRLIQLGKVDLATKTAALAACRMLCVPSMQESFGGVYVEAWSLRKPVIGGDIPPIAKVIDHGDDGLLCRQCPEQLADSIRELLSDPHRAAAMGRRGWEKVQRKYTWQRIAQQTAEVYRSLGVEEATLEVNSTPAQRDAISSSLEKLQA